jgi:hypothetical protein
MTVWWDDNEDTCTYFALNQNYDTVTAKTVLTDKC